MVKVIPNSSSEFLIICAPCDGVVALTLWQYWIFDVISWQWKLLWQVCCMSSAAWWVIQHPCLQPCHGRDARWFWCWYYSHWHNLPGCVTNWVGWEKAAPPNRRWLAVLNRKKKMTLEERLRFVTQLIRDLKCSRVDTRQKIALFQMKPWQTPINPGM